MKEVVLKWRGRDITVKYEIFNHGGNYYASVFDKNGKETRLIRRSKDGQSTWRGGINEQWPDDLIDLFSNLFDKEVVKDTKPDNMGGR